MGASLVFLGAGCTRTTPPPVASSSTPISSSMPNPTTNPHVILTTNHGVIEVELFAADSPTTVGKFLTLARSGFYDGTQFHRVIQGFMIQGGDPLTKQRPNDFGVHGTGGPGYQFADEFNAHPLVRGSFAMANAGPNTNGSQFFIVTAPSTPWLDGKHTNFGRVVSGMEVVDAIERVRVNGSAHPLEPVTVQRAEVRQ
ncbi:peptidylprolyl isomerase [Candidatus Uhrbacteria bacterium]|nr:peptidylprolyl isomerase [Candidatus Uhrbacteria bacterium]